MMHSWHVHFFSVCAIILITTFTASAQVVITGFVKDKTTNEALGGALIYCNSDTAISAPDGSFSLHVRQFPITLSIQYLGYETYSATVRSSDELRIALQPSAFALNEVVINSQSGSVKVKNTASSVSVIPAALFVRDDPMFITKALNRIPGVIMQSGSYNTSRLVFRGIGSRSMYGTDKIKAYFDNIPLTDGSGTSTVEDIDQAMIGKMIITKGPNSSLYGAGLGGAINLISANPSTPVTSFKSSLTVGSFNTRRSLVQADHHDEKVSLRAVLSDTHSDGFRENNSYNRRQAGITTSYKLSKNAQLSLLALYTHMKAYIASSINQEMYDNSPEKAAPTWAASKGYEAYDHSLFGLTYTKSWNSVWKLQTSAFSKYKKAYEPRPFNILDEATWAIGTRNTIQASWEKLVFSGGFELFHDQYQWSTYENDYTSTSNGSVQGNRLSDNLEQRQYLNVFAQASYHWTSRLEMVTGINFNTTHYHLDDRFNTGSDNLSGSYTFNSIYSPKVSMIYSLNVHHTLFTNVSQGFSPPTLEETLYPSGQINPNIRPERGWNYEMGYRGSFQHLNYDLTAYYMHIKDLLVAERISDDAYIGVNAGLNKHLGIDFSANYFTELGNSGTLNVYSSAALMDYHFASFTDEGVSYAGKELPGVPRWTVNSGVELFSDRGFYGNVNMQYVSGMAITDANDLYSDDYLLLRAKAGYKRIFGQFTADMSLGVDNLTDVRYASMLLINATGTSTSAPRYYYPGMPRNYYGTLSLSYRLKDAD